MIFDIYEQQDLFDIIKCRRQATLESWLHSNHIPFTHNAKGQIMAHKAAVDAGLGVATGPEPPQQPAVVLSLGD